MARSRKPSAVLDPVIAPAVLPAELITPRQPETTGRYVVIFKEDVDTRKVRSTLSNVAGISGVASSADYVSAGIAAEDLAAGPATHFPRMGIAIISGDIQTVQSLFSMTADADSPILAIEPEYVAHALAAPASQLEYLRGYRDAVNHLYDELSRGSAVPGFETEAAVVYEDNDQYTWGLQATRVHESPYSGLGVKVAVLDTGCDLQHPDFIGRPIVGKSFVGTPTVQDGHGHGTHCIGTACGPQRPIGTRRYGVAYGATIYAGAVLNAQGSGATGGIVAGIEWAVENGCQVVSMSLGANIDQKVLQYDVPIQRALAAGTLIVAAAGNNADRTSGYYGFVGPPANGDAAMAVAALDSRLQVANFSARSSTVTGDGGKVNIAAPGVSVYSTWPMPTRYRSINGTSMATPHVAGIAALWCEATGLRGADLWAKVCQNAKALGAPSADVGAGLVQAPT